MGMFDLYIPNPTIDCPHCGKALEGWQGKEGGCGLFVWQQGIPHPIDQTCDDEFKISKKDLKNFSLPKVFTIYGGFCPDCGQKDWKGWIQSCNCYCEESIWCKTELSPSTFKAKIVDSEWAQCTNCFDVFQISENKNLYFCPSCKELNQI